LPAQYRDNVESLGPFDRRIGDQPALTEADIKDVVAFLNTLTDRYDPRQAQHRLRTCRSHSTSSLQPAIN
jgi:cytochrome c peroxidase